MFFIHFTGILADKYLWHWTPLINFCTFIKFLSREKSKKKRTLKTELVCRFVLERFWAKDNTWVHDFSSMLLYIQDLPKTLSLGLMRNGKNHELMMFDTFGWLFRWIFLQSTRFSFGNEKKKQGEWICFCKATWKKEQQFLKIGEINGISNRCSHDSPEIRRIFTILMNLGVASWEIATSRPTNRFPPKWWWKVREIPGYFREI